MLTVVNFIVLLVVILNQLTLNEQRSYKNMEFRQIKRSSGRFQLVKK